jgi:hypothetical protein
MAFAGVFYRHPKLSRFFGVRHKRSTEWVTNRKETHLVAATHLFFRVLGISFIHGNIDHIRKIKAAQQKFKRPIDMKPHFEDLVGVRLSLFDLEKFLVNAWIREIMDCYDIVLPVSNDRFAEIVTIFRKFVLLIQNDFFQGLLFLKQNWNGFTAMRNIYKTLPPEEQMMMFVPFLTPIDACLFNFVLSNEPVKEMHELFENTGLVFAPMKNKDGAVIVILEPNKENNPSNSIFGPRGVVCPGNIFTFSLMKSVTDLKRQFRVEIEGKMEFNSGTNIQQITNPREVWVTFNHRNPAELVDFDPKNGIN